MTTPQTLRSVAEAIALADGFDSAEANVLVGFKAMPVWQSRLPHARAAVAAFLASADTHAERCDVEQAQPARVGSATAKPGRPMTVEQLARDGAE